MHDPINSFITNNIHAVIFIPFLIITYWLRSEVGKLVDRLLTMKNLKATLFIILILMIFLVSNTFYNFIAIDVKLVALYMVALSAILASLVAIITIINNSIINKNVNIKNIVDKSDKVIALTYSGIARIQFFIEKSKLLKLILIDKSKISQELLLREYEIMLRNILEFINKEDLYKFSDNRIIFTVHNDIFIFLPILNKIILDIEKDNEKYYGKYVEFYKNIEPYERLIENLKKLIIVLEEIKTSETQEHQKLYEDQNKIK